MSARCLALGGSIRAMGSKDSDIVSLTDSCESIESVRDKFNAHPDVFSRLTNTEILCAIALAGVRSEGVEVDFFALANLFPKTEKAFFDIKEEAELEEKMAYFDTLEIDKAKKQLLLQKINAAQGILLSSPVYFGDRSSVCNKVMQLAGRHNSFVNKAVSALSVGAKRNGGQETTNIYLLEEALALGAYVVGNGPKTSQYGGTAVAGDKGLVLADSIGLETAFATGRRTAQMAKLLSTSPKARPNHIVVLVTMDTKGKQLSKRIREYIRESQVEFPTTRFTVVELTEGEFQRCVACKICPIPSLRDNDQSYACIIQNPNDSMEKTRELLRSADGLMLAGLNLKDMNEVIYRYQAFTERTRILRRNDFELTNMPTSAFVLEEVGAKKNASFALKVMTSYLRHNTIFCPSTIDVWHEGRPLVSGQNQFLEFLDRVDFINQRRHEPISVRYEAGGIGGYQDTRLDHTKALRR